MTPDILCRVPERQLSPAMKICFNQKEKQKQEQDICKGKTALI